MVDTKKISPRSSRPRGRPRRFDTDRAVETAERLFAERGYDALSVAHLTDAMGIKPPSFYGAFGSKAGLFARVVERYAKGEGAETGRVIGQVMAHEPDPARGIPALLDAAAVAYADGADTGAPGCLVLEAARGSADEEAVALCDGARGRTAEALQAYVSGHCAHPDKLAAEIVIALTGLSGAARQGMSREALRSFAALAGEALARRCGGDQSTRSKAPATGG